MEAHVPRHGAKVSVSLRDVQAALAFRTRWCASSRWIAKQLPTWTADFEHMGISGDHVFRPMAAGGSGQSLQVHEFMVSCAALMAILCRCASELRDEQDRASSLAMIAAFSMHGVIDSGEEDHTFTIEGGNVSFAADFGPEVSRLRGLPLHLFLLGVWRLRAMVKLFASAVFRALGDLLDRGMADKEWTRDPLHALQQQHSGGVRRRSDRHLRLAMMELPVGLSRRASRATALARRLNLDCPLSKAWEDGSYMRRYLLSLRQAMGSYVSFGIAPDKSGFPPHEFLGTSIFNTATGRIGWIPPQAHSGTWQGGFQIRNRPCATLARECKHPDVSGEIAFGEVLRRFCVILRRVSGCYKNLGFCLSQVPIVGGCASATGSARGARHDGHQGPPR